MTTAYLVQTHHTDDEAEGQTKREASRPKHKVPSTVADKADELFDKISNPVSRTGQTGKRVGRMRAAGVSRNTIASQMTDTSPNIRLLQKLFTWSLRLVSL